MPINWRERLDDAYSEAKSADKLVLIDLFNPG